MEEPSDEPDTSRVWVLPDILGRVGSFMDVNDISCGLRALNKVAAAIFKDYVTVKLSRPSPPSVFACYWGSEKTIRSLSLQKRRQLLRLTAGAGVIENFKLAAEIAGCTLTMDCFEAAAASGSLEICQWLQEHECPWDWQVLASAAREDRLKLVQWLLVAGCPSGAGVLEAAASAGHRRICEWLLAKRCEWSFWVPCAAARNGHADLAEWLMQELLGPTIPAISLRVLLVEAVAVGCDLATLQRFYTAQLRGSLGIQLETRLIGAAAASRTPDWRNKVEWLLARCNPRAIFPCCDQAAKLPDALERLQWLLANRAQVGATTAIAAAQAGNAAALSYLMKKGVRVGDEVAQVAAEAGHLGVLQALHAARRPLGGLGPLVLAAGAGHGDIVMWLLAEAGRGAGVELKPPVAVDAAAGSGNLALMKWLRERGSEWGAVSCALAEGGCGEALEWAAEAGWPMSEDGGPYHTAAAQGDLATLRHLARLGCPWGPPGGTFAGAVGDPRVGLAALQCLLELPGCVVLWGRALSAARERSPHSAEVVGWILEQQQAQCRAAVEMD